MLSRRVNGELFSADAEGGVAVLSEAVLSPARDGHVPGTGMLVFLSFPSQAHSKIDGTEKEKIRRVPRREHRPCGTEHRSFGLAAVLTEHRLRLRRGALSTGSRSRP